MARNVTAKKEGKGVSFHIEHELAGKADAALLADCVQALLDCAKQNHCLDGKISLNPACFATLAHHNAQSKCLDRCFGCA